MLSVAAVEFCAVFSGKKAEPTEVAPTAKITDSFISILTG